MRKLIVLLKRFISDRFSLHEDAAEESEIIDSIKKNVSFKGVNLWTLIFAIFIASIGLNVNSTAVIIGAMLISPLMGPIMGMGLAIGINDLELFKKGIKNLLIAATISIATSSLYFAITPLHEASSEILARTTPTIWDVFIAFIGGLAGIVAGTRKEKTNVIPGVAIATALMPPLCTAGYGLASGQLLYFLGALYLFFINSLFICLSTFLVVKHLRFKKIEFSSRENEKRVSRIILLMVTITLLPSIYLAYRIVQQSIFETNAKRFIQREFRFPRTQVVTKNFFFDRKRQSIEVLLIGEVLPDDILDTLRSKMPAYFKNKTTLVVHQGLDAKQNIDLSEIKASVLEQVYASGRQKDTFQNKNDTLIPQQLLIKNELSALYPGLKQYAITQAPFLNMDSTNADTVTLLVARFNKPLSRAEKERLRAWMKQRLHRDSIRVILE